MNIKILKEIRTYWDYIILPDGKVATRHKRKKEVCEYDSIQDFIRHYLLKSEENAYFLWVERKKKIRDKRRWDQLFKHRSL